MSKKDVIQIRVDAETKTRWLHLAAQRGTDLSSLIREAVEKLLTSPELPPAPTCTTVQADGESSGRGPSPEQSGPQL